jgi:hypothetical protein
MVKGERLLASEQVEWGGTFILRGLKGLAVTFS